VLQGNITDTGTILVVGAKMRARRKIVRRDRRDGLCCLDLNSEMGCIGHFDDRPYPHRGVRLQFPHFVISAMRMVAACFKILYVCMYIFFCFQILVKRVNINYLYLCFGFVYFLKL